MPLPPTADDIWPVIERWPFAVLGFVTPRGEPRAAGVMYVVRGRKLWVLTGPDTWKALHIRANPHVSVTVPVPRLPIRIRQVPPAVITFSGVATIHPIDEVAEDIRLALTRGLEGIGDACAIEIEPAGHFVTYGIGIPAVRMRNPHKSLARVPTG